MLLLRSVLCSEAITYLSYTSILPYEACRYWVVAVIRRYLRSELPHALTLLGSHSQSGKRLLSATLTPPFLKVKDQAENNTANHCGQYVLHSEPRRCLIAPSADPVYQFGQSPYAYIVYKELSPSMAASRRPSKQERGCDGYRTIWPIPEHFRNARLLRRTEL